MRTWMLWFVFFKSILAVIFIGLAFAPADVLPFDIYFGAMYTWGTPAYVVTALAPLIFRDAVGVLWIRHASVPKELLEKHEISKSK